MRALRIGEKAPPLPLFDLEGRPVEFSIANRRSTLLVFWNPACGFCSAMLDDIRSWEAWLASDGTRLLLVSTGSVEENLAMGLHCQIALDQNFSVGQSFGATGTPSAVLLNAEGAVASDVAAGRSNVVALANDARMAVTLKNVEWRPVGGETRTLEIQVTPLLDAGGSLVGAGVAFLDQTLQNQLHGELERANQELETASEELQSANEELETTNEELQSTIEELETTNEELQSANEELETMNEELQSTNEELRTMNDQIQLRSEELRHVNTHLHAILGSLRSAVVVLNSQLAVEVWSDKAQELWGLRNDEVQGQSFLKLDIGLPVAELATPISRCLDSGPRGAELTVDGVNRRGRTIHCRITCTRLGDGDGPPGVILLMEEVSGPADTQPQE